MKRVIILDKNIKNSNLNYWDFF